MKFTDQLGTSISLDTPPKRIISLVPSLTELLFALGLGQRIVGVTEYCIVPADQVDAVPKIGGTKAYDFALIDTIKPDLIIGNKEENDREGVARLSRNYPVWISDVVTVDDALAMIRAIGEMTQTKEKSLPLAQQIEQNLASLTFQNKYRVAYLIWKDPYMAAGGNTFINEMIEICGFANIFHSTDGYPQVDLSDLAAADLILLSSDPYPFETTHLQEIAAALPSTRPILVDGTMFCWYGQRMIHAADYFRQLHRSLS